jgi:signal transduction histidine kinase
VPIATFQPSGAGPLAHTVKRLAAGPTGRFRVVAIATVTPSGPAVVYVAAGLDTVDHAITLLSVALAFGLPVLVLVVAAATWWALGRALRPVEEIRREVDTITEQNLHRRVPTPNTSDEIQRLAVTMNAMLDRLETAADRQRRFTADASHELRSPLSAMRAQLEVALARPEQADWIATGRGVLADQCRVEHLVQDLLVLAHVDAVGDGQPHTLIDFIAVTVEEIDRRPPGDRASITLDVDDAAAWVRGVRDQLARVVRNLLDNAARHAADSVTVAVHVDGADVVLTIEDDGPGIAPADRERIFERFSRLDDARSQDDGGSGLGLPIVRAVVAAHHGHVAVVGDTPGACLEVRLPQVTP